MTIQVVIASQGKSKATLHAALTALPNTVRFYDPSVFSPRNFTGADMLPGESFPVVMDHPRRMRFATVTRKHDGTFSVK